MIRPGALLRQGHGLHWQARVRAYHRRPAWRTLGAQWPDQPEAAGCIDVDLSFTPATNLIAIRRLALDIGHASEAPAAWLHFPELTLERLEQRYHRVALDTYDYQAPGVGYAASLRVSDSGFVTQYPGLWEQEVTGNGHLPA